MNPCQLAKTTGHALLRSKFCWNISVSEKFIFNVTMPINSQNITLGKLGRRTAFPFVSSYFSSAPRAVGGVGGCAGSFWEGGLIGIVFV